MVAGRRASSNRSSRGGRIKRNYEAAQARFDQAIAQYQKAALAGYREVADSLVTIEKLRSRARGAGEGRRRLA